MLRGGTKPHVANVSHSIWLVLPLGDVGHEDGFALYGYFFNCQGNGRVTDTTDTHQSLFESLPIVCHANDQAIVVYTHQQVASLGVGKRYQFRTDPGSNVASLWPFSFELYGWSFTSGNQLTYLVYRHLFSPQTSRNTAQSGRVAREPE
jgi:hypothetical protein